MTEQYTLAEPESNNPQDELIFDKKGTNQKCQEYMESYAISPEPFLQITVAIHNLNQSPLAAGRSFFP